MTDLLLYDDPFIMTTLTGVQMKDKVPDNQLKVPYKHIQPKVSTVCEICGEGVWLSKHIVVNGVHKSSKNTVIKHIDYTGYGVYDEYELDFLTHGIDTYVDIVTTIRSYFHFECYSKIIKGVLRR